MKCPGANHAPHVSLAPVPAWRFGGGKAGLAQMLARKRKSRVRGNIKERFEKQVKPRGTPRGKQHIFCWRNSLEVRTVES